MSSSPVGKGRKRGPVWNFYTEDGPNAKCALNDKDGKPCEHLVKGRTTNNMRDHLSRRHKTEYNNCVDAEKAASAEKAQPAAADQTQTKMQAFVLRQIYPTTHPKQKNFENKAAWFFGSITIPDKAVESRSYREMIASCDPQMRPLSVTKLHSRQRLLAAQLRDNLMTDLANANTVHILSDIWSKRGLTVSCIAFCCSFYSPRLRRREVVLLSLETFPNPHTAERILEFLLQTLAKWKIPLKKVGKFLSDNGSNYQKCFTKCIQELLDQQAEVEAAAAAANEPADDSEVGEEQLDEFGLEIEDEEEDGEQEEWVNELNQLEKRLDTQCELKEIRNIGCFAHNIDLLMRSVESDPTFQALMALVSNRIGRFWHSTVAKSRIKQLAGKNLLRLSKTRWIYRYFFIQNLLDLRAAIDQVCTEQAMDQIQPTEWEQLGMYANLLQPFAQACGLMVKEHGPTISHVISTLFSLKGRLTKLAKKTPMLNALCTQLLQNIETRFGYVLNPKDKKFDAFFCAATLLDPSVSWVLDQKQLDLAKEHLAKYFPALPEPLSASSDTNEMQLPAICHESSELSELFKERYDEKQKQSSVTGPEIKATWKNELDHYISVFYTRTTSEKVPEPLEFWTNAIQYPTLSKTATDILSCPPSTAVVERVFSKAGIATSGQRMNLGGENLERELMFQINVNYR